MANETGIARNLEDFLPQSRGILAKTLFIKIKSLDLKLNDKGANLKDKSFAFLHFFAFVWHINCQFLICVFP
jgi:hypothetical protein